MTKTHYTWIKLYCEILDDPKMGRLDDNLWRRAVEIFMLAGKQGQAGALPAVDEMAWSLRTSPAGIEKTLGRLEALRIVQRRADGGWMVTHFSERQAAMTPVERQQKHRAGATAGRAPSQTGHENVTEEEGEEETETAVEAEENLSREAPAPEKVATGEVAQLTQELSGAGYNLNGNPTALIRAWLKQYPGAQGMEHINRALQFGKRYNGRTAAYVDTILRDWRENGPPPPGASARPSRLDEFAASLERTLREHPDL